MRKLIYSHFEDDMIRKKISECTEVTYRIVLRIFKVHKTYGLVKKSKSRHQNWKKLSESENEFLLKLINDD